MRAGDVRAGDVRAGDVRAGDVRQWRFADCGTQLRPGVAVRLLHGAPAGGPPVAQTGPGDRRPGGIDPGATSGPDHGRRPGPDLGGSAVQSAGPLPPLPLALGGPAGAMVTLHRQGAADRVVCGGEPVAIRVEGAGYLAAGEPGGARVVLRAGPAFEWVVGGVAPGVAVPVDAPVALFDTVQGDHLVLRAGLEVGEPIWAGEATCGLPAPPAFRPAEGVAGDVVLGGAIVPVRDGDLSAGLLVLLDPADAQALGAHLARRAPQLAGPLLTDGTVGAVACRWSAIGAPDVGDAVLPPAGARIWVLGPLVADPGVCVMPVRVLAWALDGDGDPVTAAPGDDDWPSTTLSWRVLLPALGDDAAGGAFVVRLPLPGRDGEPGSTTTTTPVAASPEVPGRVGPASSEVPGRVGPALAAGLSGGPRRVLRVPLPAAVGAATLLGCTVRVHLSEP